MYMHTVWRVMFMVHMRTNMESVMETGAQCAQVWKDMLRAHTYRLYTLHVVSFTWLCVTSSWDFAGISLPLNKGTAHWSLQSNGARSCYFSFSELPDSEP